MNHLILTLIPKNQLNKKLPYIYNHLKKSASVDNIFNEKKNSKIIGFNKPNDRIYNPSTLYGKYLPYNNQDINNKQLYSFLNNKK